MQKSKSEVRLLSDQLSLDLIEAQYALKNTRGQDNARSVLILIGGIEFAGKSEAIKQLREWLDPRYLYVKADIPNEINSKKLFWHPYVAHIPGHGQIKILFGNWYTDLMATALYGTEEISESRFKHYLAEMHQFEHYLQANSVDIIKIWFDLSLETTQQRIRHLDLSKALQRIPDKSWDNFPLSNWRNKKLYNDIQEMRKRFTWDWIIIDGEKEKQRNLHFGQEVLKALQPPVPQTEANQLVLTYTPAAIDPQLLEPDQAKLEKKTYRKRIKHLEKSLAHMLRYDHRHIIIVLEGMDAAGKGGAIKRIIKYLDPREYHIHCISAPNQHEQQKPYLWRFWNKLSHDGSIKIFDRSWYGRVLVERVAGLIQPEAWQRAYTEINQFEKSLSLYNTVVIKLWLSISKDEQLVRFQHRENTPQKYFKITADDWRNREHWDQYLQAASDMFEATDTDVAPWHIVATDDKYSARIQVLEHIVARLEQD